MRYKFRGKDQRGQWHYGSLVMGWMYDENLQPFDTAYIQKNIHRAAVQVLPETVGQYTGRGDIYEGDVLRHWSGSVGTIEWHDSWCGFYFKTALSHNEYGELVKTMQSVPLWNDLPRYLKLGNRWDNPDLLGEV